MKIRNKKTGQIIDINPADAQDYGLELPEAKYGIHIKESKKGTFTAAATKHGMGVQEFANKVLSAPKGKYSAAMRKKANFAKNAAKWKHEEGGYMQMGGITDTEMAYGGMYDMGGMYPMGGYIPMDMMAQGGINNPGFRALPEYVQEKIKANMATGGCMNCGGKMQNGGVSFEDMERMYQQIGKPAGASKLTDHPPIYTIEPTPKQKAKGKVVYPAIQPKKYIPLPESPIQDVNIEYPYGKQMPPQPFDYPVGRYLPGSYVQSPEYAEGGKMPQWLAEIRFKAAGKEGELADYGYDEAEDGKWIQKATASIKRRGTEGVCTGSKFGSSSCPPGSKRYNLAKTFRKMAKSRKKEDGGYAQGKEYEMTDAQIAKLRAMGYKIKEV